MRCVLARRITHNWPLALLLVFDLWGVLVLGIRLMHMHPDEQLAYFFTRNDLPFLWWYLETQDTHPPLWFSSFYVMRHLFGDSEFVARFYSALLSMLTLALAYQLGRRWFGAARYGLCITGLLGVNAFFFYHALEMRPYALIMLLATLSMWMLQRWLEKRTHRAALAYGVTLAAMLYVHYFLIVLIMVQGVYILLAWWSKRQPLITLLRQAALAGGAAFVLWLPWLPAALHQVENLRRVELLGGNQRGVVGAGTTTVITSWDAVVDLAQTATGGLPWLYIPLIIAGVLLLWRREQYRLALVWGVGAPALSLALNTVAAVYTPRYVLYMVIGVAVMAGAGLAALPLGRVRWTALVVLMTVSLWVIPGQLPNRTPYRDLFLRVGEMAQPGDVIFFDQQTTDSRFVQWQVRHYLPRELRQNRAETIEEARAHQRVWYVTDDWFNPRVQDNFRSIEADHPLQRVFGDCTSDWCYLIQLLEANPGQP